MGDEAMSILAEDNVHGFIPVDEPALQFKDAETFERLRELKQLDTILKRIETDGHPELKEARDLILRISRRELYQHCNELTVPRLEHLKNGTPQQIICSKDSGGISLNEEDIAVSNIKIDLTQGRNNPLKSIQFFQNYESTVSEPIEDLPGCSQDRIVGVYAKKPELVPVVSKALLPKTNSHLRSSSSVSDPAEFWKLDDTILQRIETDTHPALKEVEDLILQIIRRVLFQMIETDTHPEFKEARDLILQIKRRVLYQVCNEFISPKERLEPFKLPPQKIICSQDIGPVSKESFCRQVLLEVGGRTQILNIHENMYASSLYSRLGLDSSLCSLMVGRKVLKEGDSLDTLESLSLITVYRRLRGGCRQESQAGFEKLHTILRHIAGFKNQYLDLDDYWGAYVAKDGGMYQPRKLANKEFLEEHLQYQKTLFQEAIKDQPLYDLIADGRFSRTQLIVPTEGHLESAIELAQQGIWNGFRVQWAGSSAPTRYIVRKAAMHGIEVATPMKY